MNDKEKNKNLIDTTEDLCGTTTINDIKYFYLFDNWRLKRDIHNNLIFECFNKIEWKTRCIINCHDFDE